MRRITRGLRNAETMKILIVSLFLPQEKSYHAGGRFVYEIIRNIAGRHEVTLVTRLEEKEIPFLESLKPFCQEVFPYTYKTKAERGLIDKLKLVCNYLGFSLFADRIAQTGMFDFIQAEWVESAVLLRKRLTPMALDAHDVLTKPARRIFQNGRGLARVFLYVRYFFIKTLERRILGKFDLIFTRSDKDKDYLHSMNTGKKVSVISHPAGLDITDRTFVRKRNTILFLASYKYRKTNVDAALYFYHSVFPLVKKRIPEAKFIIAGYRPPPEELTSLQEKDGSVSVPGFVDSLDECYKRATVFVAPILVGGGIIVKVLDAMAAGTPVVTTTFGNEGVGAVSGRDLIVADDTESFAAGVIGLLTDTAFASRLAANGREFVRENYSREIVMRRIEETYREIVNGKGQKSVKREW